jgi:hypothetical protein
MVELEQMREKYRLHDKVTLLGGIKPSDVQTVSLVLSLSSYYLFPRSHVPFDSDPSVLVLMDVGTMPFGSLRHGQTTSAIY